MSSLAIPAILAATDSAPKPTTGRDPDKVHDAAQQFEALLLGQILRGVRESGAGWLGSTDSSAECATDFAEQQFAAVLAKQGGLGLATLITNGLTAAPAAPRAATSGASERNPS
jgi:peptidoglycan hydrolase FlgJ